MKEAIIAGPDTVYCGLTRFIAKNKGNCRDRREDVGRKVWVFVDEINVEYIKL